MPEAGQSNLTIWSGAIPSDLGMPQNGSLVRLRDHIHGCLHSDTMLDAIKVVFVLHYTFNSYPLI